MNIVTLDVETTASPNQQVVDAVTFFENHLVSVGYKHVTDLTVDYLCFYHTEERETHRVGATRQSAVRCDLS